MEIWKPIKDYPNYEISNLGKVKNIKTNKLISVSVHKHGHHVVRLWSNSKTRLFNIYRLLAIHFIPNPENKREVNHIDGNRMNFELSNLEWVTASENMKHSFRTGLAKGFFKKAGDHIFAKLSNEDRMQIVELRKNRTYTLKELSERFKVNEQHISKIATGYYDRKKEIQSK